MIAAVAEVGIPSVSSGTSVPENDALLAASGPATPSIALAELLLVAAELALGGVGEERRHLGAAGGQRAEREADAGAPQPRAPRALHVLAGHPVPAPLELVLRLHELLVAVAGAQPRRHVQGLADREEPHRHDHDVDPVAELVDAEGQPRLAGQLVDPHEADQQADGERDEAADQRARRERRHRRERQ
jgi:hypothetical protein